MALFFLIAFVAKEMRASAISRALRLACRSPPQGARMIDELGIAAGREGKAFGHARHGKPLKSGSVAALPSLPRKPQ